MPQLKVMVSQEVGHEFRRVAMHANGYVKGALSASAQEALHEWSRKHSFSVQEARKILGDKDPIESFVGVLKHVKKSSVQLQHEAGRIRSSTYARARR